MSGPGGSVTKRDKRRDARRAELERRQLERRREMQRQLRTRRIKQGSIIGGSLVVLILIIGFVAVALHGQPSGNPTTATGGHGQTIDNIACTPGEGTVTHIHSYVEIYVNGQQQTIPGGIGIVGSQCYYALHVHDGEPNIVHIESPTQRTYTLGEFFDIWGNALSSTQVEGNTASASKTLTFEVFDANGKETTVSDPRSITFADHETIAILYNSPNVKAKPFANWSQYNL